MRNPFSRAREASGPGPDYAHVSSPEEAERLVASGELARLHLLPTEWGGTDDPGNVVYVPPFVVDLKQRTDTLTIGPLVEQGTVTAYDVTPHYDGASHVPSSIEIHASDPGELRVSLRIWGSALEG